MRGLQNVKGVGTKSLQYLKNLNINSVEDLLTYYPYKFNFIRIDNIKEVQNNENVMVHAIIDSYPIFRRFNAKMNSLSFRSLINGKIVNTIIFNRSFLKTNLNPGRKITIIGKYEEARNTLVASDIKFELVQNGTIETSYHLTNGLSQKNIKKYIDECLVNDYKLEDDIPEYLSTKYEFITKEDAVKKIHHPRNVKDIKDAKVRLKYEELFKFMFKINYLAVLNKEIKMGYVRLVKRSEIDKFIKTLPFELTKDQLSTVDDIYNDLCGNYKMNRLLQGDVGSGKTVIAVIATYINYLAKFQSALMAPTEVLAMQHYESISKLLIGTDMKVALLTGSMKKSEKDSICEKLKAGKIDLIIGTHALLSSGVDFKKLSLIITDEQHRFGVAQRALLKNKGSYPDILYMSATPIPRSFALTLYGDMDISNIKSKPVGRKEIKTIVTSEKQIDKIFELMQSEIMKGHQIYVISPLIEESETLDLSTVNTIKKQIDEFFNKKITTEIMHGKLSKSSKETIMESFKNGEINVLISTTIIEVGVDVKNATMMVIFDAERFGLSTLHQLRGRIGRNEYESICVLVGSKQNKRLKIMSESNDGFYITEQDFLLRGEGDLFGVKQSGDMTFKIASLKDDFKILMQAKEDSIKFINDNKKDDFINYKVYNSISKDLNNID